MPSCYVFGCKTGFDCRETKLQRQNGSVPKLKMLPKDPVLRAQWIRKINRKDKPITEQNAHNVRVCFLHFAPHDIVERTMTKSAGVRTDLAKDACPCIFENQPSYMTKVESKRKSPIERYEVDFTKSKKRKTSDTAQQIAQLSEEIPSVTEMFSNEDEQAVDSPVAIVARATTEVSCTQKTVEEVLTLQSIKDNIDTMKLPGNSWGTHVNEIGQKDFVIFSKINADSWSDRTLTLTPSLNGTGVLITLKLNNRAVPLSSFKIPKTINTLNDLCHIINDINALNVCSGVSCKSTDFSRACQLIIDSNKINCLQCKYDKTVLRRTQMKKENNKFKKADKSRRRLSFEICRLKKQVKQHKETIAALKEECKKLHNSTLEENADFQLLPDNQKKVMQSCISNAKKKSPNGNRYDNSWLYDCILMRIKSPKLYDSLRRKNLLPLPSRETLRLAIKNLRSTYGFQEATFKLLKDKATSMTDEETHGVLLFDEMKLSEAIKFNKETLKVEGFVDLGSHTPKNQSNTKGDHGMVVMFQPFRGPWVQVLGCFLAHGCVNGNILTKIVLEATILCEASGLQVDGVVTDGARWNRTMWKNFGVSINRGRESKCCSAHPIDAKRKLFFFSDFPHLLKCMRNNLQDREEFQTPDGLVQLQHWDFIVEQDEKKAKFNALKRCPRLSRWMVRATNNQKMNVLAPFRVFSNSVAGAMTCGREEGIIELKDSEPSSTFCAKVNKISDAMNNNSMLHGLSPGSEAETVIADFRDFLHQWQEKIQKKRQVSCTKKNKDGFLTDVTAYGFFVTLNSTLQLSEYLCNTCEWKYVLTRKFNQDNLENFFGMIRACGGCSTHPDPIHFVQLVRLLSLYSLIKPPQGSNVPGAQMVESLLSVDDSCNQNAIRSRQLSLSEKLDTILNKGEKLQMIPDIFHDHDYSQQEIDKMSLGYLSGYVAKTGKRWTNDCEACQATLIIDSTNECTKLIELRSKGYLVYPSQELVNLLRTVECAIQEASIKEEFSADFLFHIVHAVERRGVTNDCFVGCSEHQEKLTKEVLRFYLICRMFFITKDACKRNTEQQYLTKSAHLT